jgi:hypothetical protein
LHVVHISLVSTLFPKRFHFFILCYRLRPGCGDEWLTGLRLFSNFTVLLPVILVPLLSSITAVRNVPRPDVVDTVMWFDLHLGSHTYGGETWKSNCLNSWKFTRRSSHELELSGEKEIRRRWKGQCRELEGREKGG